MMASTSNKQENRNDVTKAIHDAVTKMMARAAVNKNRGRHFDIDKDRCRNFIDQQIELVPPTQDFMCNQPQGASESAVMYQDVTIVRNSSKHTFRVPISKKTTADHTEISEDRHQHEGSSSASVGIGESFTHSKGAAKSSISKFLPLGIHGVSVGTTGTSGLSRLGTTIDTTHQEYALREVDVPEKTNVILSPKGAGICTIQLVLRARKNLEVKVYQKRNTEVGAQIGAGTGAVAAGVSAVAGGATLGAVIGGVLGTVVPGVGNAIGIAVGGSIGGIVGGAGLGVAGAGLGAGLGAAAGAGGAAARAAMCPIKLTIEEIFKESMNESGKKSGLQHTSGDYIYCTVDYTYITDYSLTSIN